MPFLDETGLAHLWNNIVAKITDVAQSVGTPTVTTDDNGKFLRVVDGTWTATTVPNAEEASF